MRKIILILLLGTVLISGCTTPNLEKPICIEIINDTSDTCGIATFQINENLTRNYLINCDLEGFKIKIIECGGD